MLTSLLKVELLDNFRPSFANFLFPTSEWDAGIQPIKMKLAYSDGSYYIAAGEVLFKTVIRYAAPTLPDEWCGVVWG